MELYINKIAHYLPETVVPNSYFKDINGLDVSGFIPGRG